MTRQLHDQLMKEYLEEVLTPLGRVTTSKDVKSEVQEIDVWFIPTNTSINSELGILGKTLNERTQLLLNLSREELLARFKVN